MIPDSSRAASRTKRRRWDNCVWKSLTMSAILLVGATLNAKGQSQYLPSQSNQAPQPYYRPATPPSLEACSPTNSASPLAMKSPFSLRET